MNMPQRDETLRGAATSTPRMATDDELLPINPLPHEHESDLSQVAVR